MLVRRRRVNERVFIEQEKMFLICVCGYFFNRKRPGLFKSGLSVFKVVYAGIKLGLR
jgi:hypothetical protein